MRLTIFLFWLCFSFLFSTAAHTQELRFQIEETTAKMGEEMCVDIMASNFDLIGFQFTISWDSTILDFSKVIDPKLPFFLEASYQDFPDMLRIAWINENISSAVTLPNDSPVFTLCFIPKKTGTSTLYFDKTSATSLHPEFIKSDGTTLDATLVDGTVTVVGCSAINTTINKTICEGENYEGRVLEGTYVDTYTSTTTGCDSIRTLLLTVAPTIRNSETRTICPGACLNIRGVDFCEAGTYNLVFTSSSGCDSLITLSLQLVDQMQGTSSIQLCPGEFWVEGGTALDEAGSYNFMYTSSAGCDSLHTLQLSYFEEDLNTSSAITRCEGEDYGGRTISGIYTDTFTNSNGCDSTHTLTLTFLPSIEREEEVNICQGQSYQGYSQSGRYRDTFTGSGGCDSTRILNLTVSNTIRSTITTSICEGESFEGLSVTGVYENTFTAASGCDSIRTLNLTVLPQSETIIETGICKGTSFEGHTSAGTYTNILTNSNGCDSIRRIILSILPDDNIACQSTPTIDIDASHTVSIYPNPIAKNLFIEWNREITATYTILDMSGKIVVSKSSQASLSLFDLSHLLSGVYYLRIEVEGHSHYAKLLKL